MVHIPKAIDEEVALEGLDGITLESEKIIIVYFLLLTITFFAKQIKSLSLNFKVSGSVCLND